LTHENIFHVELEYDGKPVKELEMDRRIECIPSQNIFLIYYTQVAQAGTACQNFDTVQV